MPRFRKGQKGTFTVKGEIRRVDEAERTVSVTFPGGDSAYICFEDVEFTEDEPVYEHGAVYESPNGVFWQFNSGLGLVRDDYWTAFDSTTYFNFLFPARPLVKVSGNTK